MNTKEESKREKFSNWMSIGYWIELLKWFRNENIFFFFHFQNLIVEHWKLNSHRDYEIWWTDWQQSIEWERIRRIWNFNILLYSKLRTKQNALNFRVSVQMKRNGIFHIMKYSEDFVFGWFPFRIPNVELVYTCIRCGCIRPECVWVLFKDSSITSMHAFNLIITVHTLVLIFFFFKFRSTFLCDWLTRTWWFLYVYSLTKMKQEHRQKQNQKALHWNSENKHSLSQWTKNGKSFIPEYEPREWNEWTTEGIERKKKNIFEKWKKINNQEQKKSINYVFVWNFFILRFRYILFSGRCLSPALFFCIYLHFTCV